MLDKPVLTRVLLPAWMFEQAKDREEFKKRLAEYMGVCYPDYTIKAVKGKFAICERNERRT